MGGLSEGNVQLAQAIATDISDESQRGATIGMVGVCFSIAFTFGPALGAALSRISVVATNPFAAAAGFSLFLIVTETIYLYFCLPETLPTVQSNKESRREGMQTRRSTAAKTKSTSSTTTSSNARQRTNSHILLNLTHFFFILFFSGMEFSLPFMTYDLFSYGSSQTGRLLAFMGLVASILQAKVTRSLPPLRVVQLGVLSCAASLLMLSRLRTEAQLYGAASLLAVTSGTVVPGLTSLSSLEAEADERGSRLGNHRSFGE